MDKKTRFLLCVISALTIVAGFGMASKSEYSDAMFGLMVGASLTVTTLAIKEKKQEIS